MSKKTISTLNELISKASNSEPRRASAGWIEASFNQVEAERDHKNWRASVLFTGDELAHELAETDAWFKGFVGRQAVQRVNVVHIRGTCSLEIQRGDFALA